MKTQKYKLLFCPCSHIWQHVNPFPFLKKKNLFLPTLKPASLSNISNVILDFLFRWFCWHRGSVWALQQLCVCGVKRECKLGGCTNTFIRSLCQTHACTRGSSAPETRAKGTRWRFRDSPDPAGLLLLSNPGIFKGWWVFSPPCSARTEPLCRVCNVCEPVRHSGELTAS